MVGLGVGRWRSRSSPLPPPAGLYPVATIATAALAFGAADSVHGSGFLRSTWRADARQRAIPAKSTVTTFHQGLAWVAQLSMFMVLGLLVFPSQLGPVALEGTGSRSCSCSWRGRRHLLATLGLGFSWRSRRSWAGRACVGGAGGARDVPGDRERPGSLEFFNIVFFAVIVSTVLQGTTFEPLAARLGVTHEPALPGPLTEAGTTGSSARRWSSTGWGEGRGRGPARPPARFAPRCVAERDRPRGQAIPPRGSTRIEAGDRMHVLVRQEVAAELAAGRSAGSTGRSRRAAARARGAGVIFSARPWNEADGDPSRPASVLGGPVWSTCGRGATSRVRWWRWTTAVSRPRDWWSRGRAAARCRPTAGGGSTGPGRRRKGLVAGGHRRLRAVTVDESGGPIATADVPGAPGAG